MHDAPISLPPGTCLNNGRYIIEWEINRGATAVVYAAQDAHNPGQHVALKVMNGPNQLPVKVVKREIAFSTGVSHENIVRLLDVFAEKAQLVIVWELISGPDLLDLLNEHSGCMPEPLAAFYFCQLLKAVTFMHDHGFCHRDIKPENAMIERHNHRLKLIDFGLSKHLESARTRGVGTPDYLAPEMLQVWNVTAAGLMGSMAPYDARAVDAWAMGVLMYLLVTGKYPFEDPAHPNNLPYTIQNVLAGRIRPFPDHVSPGCRRLITNLLRIEPTQRTTLQALTCDEWLVGSALNCAATLGRMDLLDGLPLAVQQHQQQHQHQFAGGSAQPAAPAYAGAQAAPPMMMMVDSKVRSAHNSSTEVHVGAGQQAPAMPDRQQNHSPMCIDTNNTNNDTTPHVLPGSSAAPQAPALHPAVLLGWPTGRVLPTQPAGGLYAGAASQMSARTLEALSGQQGNDPMQATAAKPKGTLGRVCHYLKRKLDPTKPN